MRAARGSGEAPAARGGALGLARAPRSGGGGDSRLRGRAWGRRRISGDSSAQSSLAGVQALLPLSRAPRPGGRWTGPLGLYLRPRVGKGRGVRGRVPARGMGAGGWIPGLGCWSDRLPRFLAVLRVNPPPHNVCFLYRGAVSPRLLARLQRKGEPGEAAASPTSEESRELFGKRGGCRWHREPLGAPSWGLSEPCHPGRGCCEEEGAHRPGAGTPSLASRL